MPSGRELLTLVRRAVGGWVEDGAPTMGASLAFYTLFSLAPVLLIVIGLAGVVVGREEAQAALVAEVTRLTGERAGMAVEDILDSAAAWEEGVMPAVVGLLAMVIGATTVFAELRTDLDRIWRARPARHGSLARLACARFFSFLMVLAIGLLLLLSLVASAALTGIGTQLFDQSPAVLRLVEFVVSFVVVTGLFALIYKILPSTRLAWSDVWLGAAVTSALFWAGKLLIGIYLARTAPDSTFGAAGALVLLIVWVYYSAQIFFLGAELTREFALRHGSRRAERRRRAPLEEMRAANDGMVHRARDIVRGRDRLLLQK